MWFFPRISKPYCQKDKLGGIGEKILLRRHDYPVRLLH